MLDQKYHISKRRCLKTMRHLLIDETKYVALSSVGQSICLLSRGPEDDLEREGSSKTHEAGAAGGT